MLKIDTEGFDPAVLWGSVASLRRKAVAMIMFEYNAPNIWAVTPLRTMVAWLEQLDYVCYFEGMPRIYKLGRGCWNDAYEIHNWSNVVGAATCVVNARNLLDVIAVYVEVTLGLLVCAHWRYTLRPSLWGW
jgi:hypothetical protein